MANDPKNPFMDMFRNFGESMNIPSPDVSSLMDMHSKNLQALQQAAEIGANGAQALMDKQRAALEEALSDIAETVQGLGAGTDVSAVMTNQMELAKKSFDTTLRNTTEMAEIVSSGNAEAMDVLKKRLTESLEELTGKKPG